MERTLVIVGRRHGATALEVISGPEVPYVEQAEKFMPFRANRENAAFEFAALCELAPEREERLLKPAQVEVLKEGKSAMKKLKSLVALIVFAILALMPAAHAQSYNQINSGFAATFNIAGASTNTTVAATNGSAIYVAKANSVAIQPTFKLTEAGTSTVVFKFDESVDGSTWKIASRSISVAAAGTTTVGTVLNLTDVNGGFMRLSQIENPNTGALTNIVLKYASKTP